MFLCLAAAAEVANSTLLDLPCQPPGPVSSHFSRRSQISEASFRPLPRWPELYLLALRTVTRFRPRRCLTPGPADTARFVYGGIAGHRLPRARGGDDGRRQRRSGRREQFPLRRALTAVRIGTRAASRVRERKKQELRWPCPLFACTPATGRGKLRTAVMISSGEGPAAGLLTIVVTCAPPR